jgi:hypothetical protein
MLSKVLVVRCIMRYFITVCGRSPGLWQGLWCGTPTGRRNKGRASYDFIKTLHCNIRVSFGSGFCQGNMIWHVCTSALTSGNYLLSKFFIFCNNAVDVQHTR